MNDSEKYCVLAVIRYLNGDFEEYQKLRDSAIKHYEIETAEGFKMYELVPKYVIEKMKAMVA